ncbi:MAG TPA: Uma2 family endonuclease [Bryobacteraceae bacterium]|nr:Uma2 family endonuclease [Bryobacteraceae bacterium]
MHVVSEQQYLKTTCEPECEFDRGTLIKRNAGEPLHGLMIAAVSVRLHERREQSRIQVLPIQRIHMAPGQYAVPDLCVYRQPAPRDPIPAVPPFLAIEILSPEDRMSRVRKKIDEYSASPTIRPPVKDGVLRTAAPAIEVPLADLFQALDE